MSWARQEIPERKKEKRKQKENQGSGADLDKMGLPVGRC